MIARLELAEIADALLGSKKPLTPDPSPRLRGARGARVVEPLRFSQGVDRLRSTKSCRKQ
ncbi:hypothetical protein Poly41_19680 [Novipirellula artificiosorum]|uniref:Uncharacterized protein n=1 Tax=Novipirellula artificiosorum TaxID=2528016 RepID=A0A5C6DWL2_9BACT|nr:hypothetical protein Poly41_19680 [Novipirellula artificiosorum]